MPLEPGNAAPLFSLPGAGGETISLESLRGHKIVLYFYPKDDTCLLYTSPSPRD